MKAIHVLGVSVMAVAMSASAAFAKVTDESKGQTSAAVAPLPKASTLADNVVVAPQGQAAPAPAPAPAPAAAPTQVNVAPTESAPAYAPPHKTGVTEDIIRTTWRPSPSARCWVASRAR